MEINCNLILVRNYCFTLIDITSSTSTITVIYNYLCSTYICKSNSNLCIIIKNIFYLHFCSKAKVQGILMSTFIFKKATHLFGCIVKHQCHSSLLLCYTNYVYFNRPQRKSQYYLCRKIIGPLKSFKLDIRGFV